MIPPLQLTRKELKVLREVVVRVHGNATGPDRATLGGVSQKIADAFAHSDAHGELNPDYNGSFRFVIHDEPGGRDAATEEDGWRYKVTLIDNKFLDSDEMPITSHPHGNTREEAYACAADFIRQATESEECIF